MSNLESLRCCYLSIRLFITPPPHLSQGKAQLAVAERVPLKINSIPQSNILHEALASQNCSGVRHLMPFRLDVSSIKDGSAIQDFLMVACAGIPCAQHCQGQVDPENLNTLTYTSVLYSMSANPVAIPPAHFPEISFVQVTRIGTSSRAVWWQRVELCARQFLLVANHFDQQLSSYYVPSAVYALRQSAGSISEVAAVQTFMTMGAAHIEVFTLNGQTLVALSNYYNGSSYHVPSAIYSFGREYRQMCGPGVEPASEILLIAIRVLETVANTQQIMII